MFGDIMQGAAAITDSFTNIINSGYNIYNTERNYNWQKHLFDYQKRLQQQIFNREDTAVQRRAADLKAAGFNPLLAAGGAASSGAAVNTSANNVPSPNIKSSMSEIVAQILSMKKMNTDISMTKSQQELINEQADQIRKNNQLLQLQIDWYENHPGYAPGVESGFHTGKGLTSSFDSVSNRLMPTFYKPQVAHPSRTEVFNFHLNNGLSAKEAARRTDKFFEKFNK